MYKRWKRRGERWIDRRSKACKQISRMIKVKAGRVSKREESIRRKQRWRLWQRSRRIRGISCISAAKDSWPEAARSSLKKRRAPPPLPSPPHPPSKLFGAWRRLVKNMLKYFNIGEAGCTRLASFCHCPPPTLAHVWMDRNARLGFVPKPLLFACPAISGYHVPSSLDHDEKMVHLLAPFGPPPPSTREREIIRGMLRPIVLPPRISSLRYIICWYYFRDYFILSSSELALVRVNCFYRKQSVEEIFLIRIR